jgi:sialic acid synthase SpsE
MTVGYIYFGIMGPDNFENNTEKTTHTQETVTKEDYEDDSDDSSSTDSTASDNEEVLENKESVEIPYPKMHKLFSKMSRRQLIRIVGKSFKNDSKQELVNIALDKFKKYTIEKSFESFKYLPKYIKHYANKNFEEYYEELNDFFSYSTNVVKE